MKIERNKKKVTKIVEEDDNSIVLHLDDDEAEMLLDIIGGIAGSPMYKSKKFVDKVYDSLKSVGVKPAHQRTKRCKFTCIPSITD